MDDRSPDADKLPIRCPGCGQRFKVGQELKDRMVECGTCEHRFRVNEEVVVRTKKFYPGERRDRGLDQFSRIPKGAGIPANFQTVQYSQEPVHVPIAGTSPLRMIFGMVAVIAVALVLTLLALGGRPGGMLDGATMDKRLMLAGFTAVLAAVFLIAANPAARVKATVGAIFCAALLISFPFFFTEGNQPRVSQNGPIVLKPVDTKPEEPAATPLATLKEQLVPLMKEIARYESVPGNLTATGLWLHGVEGQQKQQIKDYIVRASGADPSSHLYPRDRDYLMVVSGVSEDIEPLKRLCARFGEVKRVVDELRLIEVAVDRSSFLIGSQEKLSNPADPAFYELNRRELESIDLERARNAVNRLAEAAPKLYRKDITARMQQLLKEGDAEMQDHLSRALLVWSEPGDGTEDAARVALAKFPPAAGEAPESMVKLLALRKDEKSIPLVAALWLADHNRWEELYSGFGPGIEKHVIEHFGTGSMSMRRSAARLLGKVGGKASIPVLEAARPGADSELAVFIDRSLAAIRTRGNQ